VTQFQINDPSLESQWRAIILFGKNSATYKFAFAKAIIEVDHFLPHLNKKAHTAEEANIINQTGKTKEKRLIFLQAQYNQALSYSIHEWEPWIELPGNF